MGTSAVHRHTRGGPTLLFTRRTHIAAGNLCLLPTSRNPNVPETLGRNCHKKVEIHASETAAMRKVGSCDSDKMSIASCFRCRHRRRIFWEANEASAQHLSFGDLKKKVTAIF